MSDSPWAATPSRSRRPSPGRLIEIVTVLLLAAATVGSAWSAYQVAEWNGISTDEARTSAALRFDAARQYGLATQVISYDASAVAQYAEAVASGNQDLQTFIRDTLVRPAFRPTLDAWRAAAESGRTPPNLFENDEYLDRLLQPSRELDDQALAASVRVEEAGANADGYIRLTLFFASALFFAGITASFRTRTPRIILLAAAATTLAAAGLVMSDYPIA